MRGTQAQCGPSRRELPGVRYEPESRNAALTWPSSVPACATRWGSKMMRSEASRPEPDRREKAAATGAGGSFEAIPSSARALLRGVAGGLVCVLAAGSAANAQRVSVGIARQVGLSYMPPAI